MHGTLEKMPVKLGEFVEYTLPIGDKQLPLNEMLSKKIKLKYSGSIFCLACGRRTNKSFNQGYCYPCFKKLAACDSCIIKPEQCHYHEGTCREPEWADQHCMQEHIVYLANSSGLKVGITRATQIPTRWIDQGAVQALPVFRVANRYLSGLVEVAAKKFMNDRTDWRRMLKGKAASIDLHAARDKLISSIEPDINSISDRFGSDAVLPLDKLEVTTIQFPVKEYPQKVTSLNFDKTPEISGTLQGIKGQYLILDSGVLNIRKFGGYEVLVEIE